MNIFKTINKIAELPPGTQVLNNSNKVINFEGHQYRVVGKKEQTLSLCERITRLMRALLPTLFIVGLAFRSVRRLWMQVWTGKETVYFGILQKALSIENFPDELILNIFKFLSPGELGKASRVCKEWRRLASDQSLLDVHYLKTVYPGFNIIDEKVWEKHVDLNAYGIDVTSAPSLDKHTLMPIVHRLSKQVEGGEGVTLLTIPKGLTFDKLLQLAKNPKQGNAVPIKSIFSLISQKLGDISVDKTYVVAITNSVFANSRNRSAKDQQQLVNNLGFEMPGVLPVTALAILTYMSSTEQPPVPLYNTPLSYTRCLEEIEDVELTVVAGFTSAWNVSPNFCYEDLGAAALRKFL